MSRYSIIIPTLNEEKVLAETLDSLYKTFNNAELIITDGGSNDSTLDIAEKYSLKVVHSSPGRGIQFNDGVKQSSGDILIFLHADTILPPNAMTDISKAFESSEVNIASFRMRFNVSHPLLTIYSFFTRFDSLFSNFGDQVIIIRRNFLEELNGFKNYKIFEDVDLLQRARKLTRVKKLNSYVVTSARRFEKQGVIRTQLLNLWYILKYFINKDTDKIYKDYFMTKGIKNKNAVVIFVKLPIEGKVKTRLAETLGSRFALKFYNMCCENIFNEMDLLSTNGFDIHVFYENNNNRSKIKKWVNRNYLYTAQSGSNLGIKISNAFELLFSKSYSKSVLIGSDIPDITANYINKAISELENNDVILSPSPDGGYNMIALKEASPELFNNIKWSSNAVLKQTIENIKLSGKKYKLLEELIDIDNENDLNKWIGTGLNKHLISRILAEYDKESIK